MKSPLAIAAAALLIGQNYAPPTAPAPSSAAPQTPAAGGAGGAAAFRTNEPAVTEPSVGATSGGPAGTGGTGQVEGPAAGAAGAAPGQAPATSPDIAAQGQAGGAAAPSPPEGTQAEGPQAGTGAQQAQPEEPTPRDLEAQQLEALRQGFDGMQQQLQTLAEIAAANAEEAAQLRAQLEALTARGEAVSANRQQRVAALDGVSRSIEQTGEALAVGVGDVQGQLDATRQSLEGVIGNANSYGGGGGERHQASEALRYVQAAQERVDNGDFFTARQYLLIASDLAGQAIGASDVSSSPEFTPTVSE